MNCLFDRREVERKHRGGWAEMVACCWLLQQGYEVFRNVSAHGAIDVVGFKNGEMVKFDVKGVNETWAGTPLLRDEQVDLGVKLLAVYDDGTVKCFDPLVRERMAERLCASCEKPFMPTRRTQLFCTNHCRTGKKQRTHSCVVCHREFAARVPTQQYCGQTCYSAAQRKRKEACRTLQEGVEITKVVFPEKTAVRDVAPLAAAPVGHS